MLHTYTRLKMSSSKVSVIMRNMSESSVVLKKGMQVARVVSAWPVELADLSPEIEAALGGEDQRQPLSVSERQEKLMDKLDLSRLGNWTPCNAVTACGLVLGLHNVFMLQGHELGCTSVVEHKIWITDSEPFKERFRRIPPPLLEQVCASLHDMLDAGAICPS